MAPRLFALLLCFTLACCAGGAGALQVSPPASQSMAYTFAYNGGTFSGPIDFWAWVGTWPNVTLGVATVTVSGAILPITVTPTESCATASTPIGSVFTITQGNNGSCVFIVQDAANTVLPIVVSAGLPGQPLLQINGVTPQNDQSFALTLSSAQTVTAFETLVTQLVGGPYTAKVYGTCASVGPSSVSSAPASFTFTPATPGDCFAIIGNSNTQSDLLRITVK